MKRFWHWIIDRKTSSVRKWQSTVIGIDPCSGEHLKPIGGSDNQLDRASRSPVSKTAPCIDNAVTSSASDENLELFEEYNPVDFEEFFEESSDAIESALVSSQHLSIPNNKANQSYGMKYRRMISVQSDMSFFCISLSYFPINRLIASRKVLFRKIISIFVYCWQFAMVLYDMIRMRDIEAVES